MKAKRKFVREFRPLYNDLLLTLAGAGKEPVSQSAILESRIPRGKLEMWCEMYTPQVRCCYEFGFRAFV